MTSRRTTGPLLLLALLVAYSAQQILFPILAPLSRQLQITETQLGLLITVSAVLVVVMSPVWGRLVEVIGAKAVLMLGLGGAGVGLVGFAAASQWAVDQTDGAGSVGYALLLLTRGLLFGAGLAAVPVAALAAIAATSDAQTRTKAVGQLGAAQGLSTVIGPLVGGLLAVGGLILPLWAAPVVVVIALVLVLLSVPDTRRRADAAGDGAPVTRLRPWNARLWPILAAGFALFLSLGLVLIILGFIVQDRLGLSDRDTATTVGVILFCVGLVLAAVQGLLVPRLPWPPLRLVRVGAPLAAVALVGLAFAGTLPLIVASVLLLAATLGLAMPGYTSAATLVAGESEQGRVAGWISAVNASTFVIGPLVGAALYSWAPPSPALLGAGVALVATAFVVFHPALRELPRIPTPA